MWGIILSLALKIGSALLGFASKGADTALEYARIKQGLDIETIRANVELSRQARVAQTTAMQYRIFWVAWALAALPLAAWFGWGMLDTLANGRLPDVASIPPGLLPWAKDVWSNIFYSGAAAAGVQSIGQVIGQALNRRK